MHVSFFSHRFLPIIELKPGKIQKITPHQRKLRLIFSKKKKKILTHVLKNMYRICTNDNGYIVNDQQQ
jgi:hypothetical protein